MGPPPPPLVGWRGVLDSGACPRVAPRSASDRVPEYPARDPTGGGGVMVDLPEVMPAAVYRRPGEVVVEERPVPRPGSGEVLVEMDHCGICGSDIHLLLEGWGDKPGLVAGHEFTGSIAA